MAQLLEGRAGVRLELPAGWTRGEAPAGEETWRGPGGVTLLAAHRSVPVLSDPFLLDDHRQDLRLLAAERGGGLVECEPILDGRGVLGLVKLPRAPGRLEVRVEAHALVPVESGHLALSLAAEEQEPGQRETEVLRLLAPLGAPPKWVADPYGRPYQRKARDREFARHQPPPDLLLRTCADDAAHDERFPAHPLTRVRTALGELLPRLELLHPCAIEVEPEVTAAQAVQLGLPLGFLPEEPLPRGQVYRRHSFAGRASALRVEVLPGAAGRAQDAALAARSLEELCAAAGVELVQGPRARERTVGRYRGVYAELELRREAGDAPRYAAAFLVPWREGDAVLLSLAGARDDWSRANRDLEAVVCCLSPWEDPSPDESGDDTAKFQHVSLNGLRRVYRVLCRLAWCDGQVDPRERIVLETFCRRHRIARSEAEALEAEAAESERLRVGRKSAERELLIETMLEVVAADGVLDPAEQARLQRIARAVELPEAQLAARIAERMR